MAHVCPEVSAKIRFLCAGDAPAHKNWIFACGCLCCPHAKIKIRKKNRNPSCCRISPLPSSLLLRRGGRERGAATGSMRGRAGEGRRHRIRAVERRHCRESAGTAAVCLRSDHLLLVGGGGRGPAPPAVARCQASACHRVSV